MSNLQTYLVFCLNGEPFSVPVQRVEEVLEYGRPTYIPRAPEYLRGIVNVRGRLIPVLDLRCRFGITPAEITTNNQIIILNLNWDGETVPLGILVDDVEGVIDLDEDTITDPPSLGRPNSSPREGEADRPSHDADFLRGTARHDGKIYMVLDVDRILVADRLHRDFAHQAGRHTMRRWA